MNADSNYVTSAPLEARLDLHRRLSVNPVGWHRWVLRSLGIGAGSKVVNLGCGTGAPWQAAGPDELHDVELVPCDASAGMLDAACSAGPASCATRTPCS